MRGKRQCEEGWNKNGALKDLGKGVQSREGGWEGGDVKKSIEKGRGSVTWKESQGNRAKNLNHASLFK